MPRVTVVRAVIALAACVLVVFPPPSADAQGAVGFISDGHLYATEAVAALMTDDLNHMDDHLPFGWVLTCLVTAGDITNISTSEEYDFDEVYAGSDLGSLPIFFSVGNHETSDNELDMPALRGKFDGYPAWNLQAGPARCPETTYSFDTGDIHVAVLNVYCNADCDTCSEGDVADELFEWLKTDLRSSAQPCKVVCAHEPAYPEVRHVGDSLDEYPAHRDRFWSLLQTEGVAAFITGHTHYRKMREYYGVYEITGGPFALGCWADRPATFTYLGIVDGDFQIHQVSKPYEENGWEAPDKSVVTEASLDYRILVNTGEGAGTPARYFVDYTALDQSPDPDWSANNGGRWWEPAFDDAAEGWGDGELGIGYDAEETWPWMNTSFDPGEGVYAVFQRIPFHAPPTGDYQLLWLETDYDDALVVWLNGTVLFASGDAPSVREGEYWNKTATGVHNAPGEHSGAPSFSAVDATEHLGLLNEGENLLAVGNWNVSSDSHDLAAGIRLSLRYHPTALPVRMSFQPASARTDTRFITVGEEAFGASHPYGWR